MGLYEVPGYIYKRSQRLKLTSFVLSYLDSNQDKQNQNLLCYHYTIGQSFVLSAKKRCKDITLCRKCQIFTSLFALMALKLLCNIYGNVAYLGVVLNGCGQLFNACASLLCNGSV